jgi:hypothetical protein
MNANARPIQNAEHAAQFIMGGNATVTFKSTATGKHFTFKVQEPKDGGGKVRFVKVLNGPDNETAYAYMGLIGANGGFTRTAKSKIGADAPSHKAFAWAWGRIAAGSIPEGLEVWHDGKCGKCGRKLTHPESLETGLGPICDGRG